MTDSKYVIDAILQQHKTLVETMINITATMGTEVLKQLATTTSLIESLEYTGFITREDKNKALKKVEEQMNAFADWAEERSKKSI